LNKVALIFVCVPNCAENIFGWLTNFTNSAGIRLSHKNSGGGAAHAKKFWRGGGTGVYAGLVLN